MERNDTTHDTPRCAYDLDYECNADATHMLTCDIPGFAPAPSCIAHISYLIEFNMNECPDIDNPRINAVAI
jgi:hypothetical protein